MSRMDGDVVDYEATLVDPHDHEPCDLAVALGDRDPVVADDLGIVVGHRSRRPADSLDVVSVRRRDQLG